jgi:processive 1,2-diacylglycerol beta-glucosyltransferase
VSEALSKKLPMIIIQPIPGQETRNCKVLADYGTAVRANNVKQVLSNIKDLIKYPEKIMGMKARIGLLSYANSAKDIAAFISGRLD